VIRTPFVERLEASRGPKRFGAAALNAARFARRSGTSLADLLRTARRMHDSSELTWAQVAMAANAPMMTKAAVVDGDLDAGILPTGQVVGAIDDLPSVAELMEGIVGDADAALRRLCSGGAAPGG
jgi:NAD(P)H-dependent flavin oxidoreductase YrpB (nitropropane dioxygenase family)